MKLTKIYDCSNSAERPPHRSESFGPKENDVVRGLKKHCKLFGCEFVDKPEDADVLFTNDVYPASVLKLDKPKVKRMDGVYWHKDLIERNNPLNTAAIQSDAVIFISRYSMESFKVLYGSDILKKATVALNCVDTDVFFPMDVYSNDWVASASNWGRQDKRFEDLMFFAEELIPDGTLYLIGNCDAKVPPNVLKYGHLDSEERMGQILNIGGAFINLSYRDPAPKVVCQAINCGLPILYADSGGTNELVDAYGVGIGIKDESKLVFESLTPRLKESDMRTAFDTFEQGFKDLKTMARACSRTMRMDYMEFLSDYFNILRKL